MPHRAKSAAVSSHFGETIDKLLTYLYVAGSSAAILYIEHAGGLGGDGDDISDETLLRGCAWQAFHGCGAHLDAIMEAALRQREVRGEGAKDLYRRMCHDPESTSAEAAYDALDARFHAEVRRDEDGKAVEGCGCTMCSQMRQCTRATLRAWVPSSFGQRVLKRHLLDRDVFGVSAA